VRRVDVEHDFAAFQLAHSSQNLLPKKVQGSRIEKFTPADVTSAAMTERPTADNRAAMFEEFEITTMSSLQSAKAKPNTKRIFCFMGNDTRAQADLEHLSTVFM
jgi:hypothetical protein